MIIYKVSVYGSCCDIIRRSELISRSCEGVDNANPCFSGEVIMEQMSKVKAGELSHASSHLHKLRSGYSSESLAGAIERYHLVKSSVDDKDRSRAGNHGKRVSKVKVHRGYSLLHDGVDWSRSALYHSHNLLFDERFVAPYPAGVILCHNHVSHQAMSLFFRRLPIPLGR